MNGYNQAVFKILLQSALGIGFLGLTVSYLDIDNVLKLSEHLDPSLFVLTAGLTLVGLFIQSCKWSIFLRHCQPVNGFWKSMDSILLGMALGLFTPGRLGELGRALAFPSNRTVTAMFAGIDRLISLFCGLIISMFCIYNSDLLAFDLILAGCIFFLLITVFVVAFRRILFKKYSIFVKFKNHLALLTNKEYFFIFAFSIVFNLLFCLQFFLLIGARYEWDLNVFTLIPVIYTVKSFIPISIGDLGVREGIAVLLFGQCGLDPEPAFGAALGVFLLNVFIPAIGGWFWCGGRIFSLQPAMVKKGS